MTATSNERDQPEPAGSRATIADYRTTIARLEMRAQGARRRVRWVGGLLAGGVLVIATVIFVGLKPKDSAAISMGNYLAYKSSGTSSLAALFAPDGFNVESLLAARVNGIVQKLNGPALGDWAKFAKDYVPPRPPTPEEAQRLRAELKEALDDLDRAVKIEAQRRPDPISSKLASFTSTLVFSLGAVAFLVLLIQIAVMFIRYHVRLAELYDAQADALRAAGGDAKLAYGFLDHFSPNTIELGASPMTIYEKALDAVKEVAARRA